MLVNYAPRGTVYGTLLNHRDALEIGATLGLVIGRAACRVGEREALAHVAGYCVVNDVSVPHPSCYRPSLRFKARDGFCPIGSLLPRDAIDDPDAAQIVVAIDGVTAQRSSTAGLVRPAARLLADVSDFMTLLPGDILCLGVAAAAPRAYAGQTVSITLEGLPPLVNRLVEEEGAA